MMKIDFINVSKIMRDVISFFLEKKVILLTVGSSWSRSNIMSNLILLLKIKRPHCVLIREVMVDADDHGIGLIL